MPTRHPFSLCGYHVDKFRHICDTELSQEKRDKTMQVTFTIDVPDQHPARLLRMRVRPGAVALRKTPSRPLPATRVMPVMASPLDDPDFMDGVMALLNTPDPAPVPKTRKASCDVDAMLLNDLQTFQQRFAISADQEQRFALDRADELAKENRMREKHGKDLIPTDADATRESAAKIAAYLLVADAAHDLITALQASYDDYLDALVTHVECLENSITNQCDSYNTMRDSIIADAVQEITRRWMGE